MTFSIRFTASASRQIGKALEWWVENRLAAPTLLADELDHAFALIVRFPGSGIPSKSPRFENVRCIVLPRSRYSIYYRVVNEVVEVVAIWHQRRGSSPRLS